MTRYNLSFFLVKKLYLDILLFFSSDKLPQYKFKLPNVSSLFKTLVYLYNRLKTNSKYLTKSLKNKEYQNTYITIIETMKVQVINVRLIINK